MALGKVFKENIVLSNSLQVVGWALYEKFDKGLMFLESCLTGPIQPSVFEEMVGWKTDKLYLFVHRCRMNTVRFSGMKVTFSGLVLLVSVVFDDRQGAGYFCYGHCQVCLSLTGGHMINVLGYQKFSFDFNSWNETYYILKNYFCLFKCYISVDHSHKIEYMMCVCVLLVSEWKSHSFIYNNYIPIL